MKKETKERLLFVVIILLAVAIRMVQWPTTISTVHIDEAMTAVNARAITQDGTDMYGTSFPVFFESWKWGGQTAFLTYCMAASIKLFGFNLAAIRLPMLLINLLSVVIIYFLVKQIFHKKSIALIAMFITAISPWHIMQTYFSLDCNMFPHVMLIGVYALVKGIDEQKRAWLYSSMIAFGIAMYTYGLATYFVPTFLLIAAIWLWSNKKVKWQDVLISVAIFSLISAPIWVMYGINVMHLHTIQIGKVTIPYLPNFERMSEVLFFTESNVLIQFLQNIVNTLKVLLLQMDGQAWNAIPFFGTTYVISILFFAFGIYSFIKKREEIPTSMKIVFLWGFISIGIGLLINGVTIYRLNIVWYPMIIMIAVGMYELCEIAKTKIPHIYAYMVAGYILMLVLFMVIFRVSYAEKVNASIFFDAGLVEAVQNVEEKGYNNVLVADYNVYRNLERTKDYIRYATNEDREAYHYENQSWDSKFTNKYHLIACPKIRQYSFEGYPVVIAPKVDQVRSIIEKNGYTLSQAYTNYAVYEKK